MHFYVFILFTILKLNILVIENLFKIIKHTPESLSFCFKAEMLYYRKLTNLLYDYERNQNPECSVNLNMHIDVFTPLHHI